MKKLYLRYNHRNDRYGIHNGTEWVNEGFHCGECLKIQINGVWVPTRMEYYDGTWYLVGTAFEGNMLNGLQCEEY